MQNKPRVKTRGRVFHVSFLHPRILCNQSHLTNPMQIFPYPGRSPLPNLYKWRLIHIKKSVPDLFNCLEEVAGMFLDLFFVSHLNPKRDTENAPNPTVNFKRSARDDDRGCVSGILSDKLYI